MPSSRAIRDERGFTLVELLVVMVILAILSAVALAMFVGQRTKAQDAEAKTTVAAAAQALTIWHQDRDTYAGAGRAELARIERTLLTARGLTINGDANSYEVSVDSAAGESGGGTYTIRRGPAGTERTCTNGGRGSCPDDERW